MSTLESALSVPFARDDWPRTLTVGTLATLATPVAPVVLLLLAGYLARVLRSADGVSPTFADAGGLLRDGLRTAVVALPMHLPAAALLAVTVGTDRLQYLAPTLYTDLSRGVVPAFGVVAALLVAVALEVVAGYLSVVLVTVVSRRRSLGAVRSPDVARLATSRRFARAVSVAAAAVAASRILAALAGVLPAVGAALSAAVTFVAVVGGASYVAQSATAVLASVAGPRKRPATTGVVTDGGRTR
jgi:hypothetical protein